MHRPDSGRYIHAVLIALLALLAAPCLAQPKFVYVFHLSPPGEVFATGFTPRGDQLEIWDYLHGYEAENTGFLAAVESAAAARWIAETFMSDATFQRGYIYQIRADENFYSLNLSAQHQRELAMATYGRADTLNQWITEFDWMRQYITDRAIPANLIVSATELSRAGPIPSMSMVVHAPVRNDRYLDADTRANAAAYDLDRPVLSKTRPSTNSSCRPWKDPIFRNKDDDEGAHGLSCEGDVLAVASSEGYMFPRLFPACITSRQKRSADLPACPTPPLINLSRRLRIIGVALADF